MLVMCPFLYLDCNGPTCPPASVSVSPFSVTGLFFCNSLLLRVCFLHSCLLPPCPPLLLCLLPFSSQPLLPLPMDIRRCVPQPKFRNFSGNFYVPNSSAFLRAYCQIISSVFVKNKILKYKVSQLQLNTALDNSKKILLFL